MVLRLPLLMSYPASLTIVVRGHDIDLSIRVRSVPAMRNSPFAPSRTAERFPFFS